MSTTAEPSIDQASDSLKESVLEAHGAVVRFSGKTVLNGIDARVSPGEIVGIVGPNGSGKTTLLRAMASLVRLDSGSITLNDSPIDRLSATERARHVGYMPQLNPDHSFTALEFVLMGRYPHIGRFKLEGRSDIQFAESAMNRTETLEFAHRRLRSLSGGEKQRVSLARLLAQNADVLLLDEPTASLDLQHQLLTMATARAEADRGVAVAVVLHDLSLASRHCDRLMLLNEGEVVAEGDPWTVVTQANLKSIFSVDAAVEPEPISGRPMVSVLGVTGDSETQSRDRSLRVHMICGAGSGRDLMHRLSIEGHTLSACVLGQGDADRDTALRLGIDHISSPPFSVVTLEQDAAHRRLVRQADVVIVCEMAVGPGNLRNLEAAAEASRLLLIERPEDSQWDYTDGYAGKVYEELSVTGTTVARSEIVAAVADAT